MPGEMAYSLWIVNQWAFEKAENHMKQGIAKGKDDTQELINILTDKTCSADGDATTSLPLVVNEDLTVDEEKYHGDLGKKSRKMRAVSLIYCMIDFYEDDMNSDVINDSICVYCQAWDFMDFVDSSDPDANLVSLTADKEFDTLQHVWDKRSKPLLKQKIRPLVQKMKHLSKQGTPPPLDTHDSEAWMPAVMRYNLYKTWKAIDSNSIRKIYDLRCLLVNDIVHCIQNELDTALIKNCSKWAEDGKEEEIYRATFIAGKAKGLREKVRLIKGFLIAV